MPPKLTNYGMGKAIASLVLGIISVILAIILYVIFYSRPYPHRQPAMAIWVYFGIFCTIATPILSITGIVLARRAKKSGYAGHIKNVGFACSLIGIITFASNVEALMLLATLVFVLFGYRG